MNLIKKTMTAMTLGALVASSGFTSSCFAQSSEMLPVGALAPDIQGKAGSGKVIKLSSTRGKYAIVYFYPKDSTPGCTTEACAFRDAFSQYEKLGLTIFGVSRDDEASHQKFRQEHKLQFPLVADPTGAIQKAYRVPNFLGLASRVSFLVGPNQRIIRVWPNVDPGVHAKDVLDTVAEHKKVSEVKR